MNVQIIIGWLIKVKQHKSPPLFSEKFWNILKICKYTNIQHIHRFQYPRENCREPHHGQVPLSSCYDLVVQKRPGGGGGWNLPFAATQAATAGIAAAAATAARTRSRPSWRSGSVTYAHSEALCIRGTWSSVSWPATCSCSSFGSYPCPAPAAAEARRGVARGATALMPLEAEGARALAPEQRMRKRPSTQTRTKRRRRKRRMRM